MSISRPSLHHTKATKAELNQSADTLEQARLAEEIASREAEEGNSSPAFLKNVTKTFQRTVGQLGQQIKKNQSKFHRSLGGEFKKLMAEARRYPLVTELQKCGGGMFRAMQELFSCGHKVNTLA